MNAVPVADPSLVEEAVASAAAAAEWAAVRIDLLADMRVIEQVPGLLREIWASPPEEAPVNPQLLRALSHTGNYVAGAFDEHGRLVGVSIGFLGREHGRMILHSHISGVAPGLQGRNVGFAMKQHQRAWALANGIGEVSWTFDPLVRRNAFFNLAKLGAAGAAYYPNFYGEMHDGLNAGDESDRCLAVWDLLSDAAREAATGVTVQPDAHGPTPGTAVILTPDAEGCPVTAPVLADAPVLFAWVPEDIMALRRQDCAAALAWRRALRATFGAALADGYRATAMSKGGWYTLTRSP